MAIGRENRRRDDPLERRHRRIRIGHQVGSKVARRADPPLPYAAPIEQLHQYEVHPVDVYADWHRSAIIVCLDATKLPVAPKEEGGLVELPQVFPYPGHKVVQVGAIGDQGL